MSDITKAEWATLEAKLKGAFARAKFCLGDHHITVEKQFVAENRQALVVFIDGYWRGDWITGEDPVYGPLVKQLWRPRRHALYSPAKKARIIKSLGKRRARELFPNLDLEVVHYDPTFNTAQSLVRQFRKVEGLVLDRETPSGGGHEAD